MLGQCMVQRGHCIKSKTALFSVIITGIIIIAARSALCQFSE